MLLLSLLAQKELLRRVTFWSGIKFFKHTWHTLTFQPFLLSKDVSENLTCISINFLLHEEMVVAFLCTVVQNIPSCRFVLRLLTKNNPKCFRSALSVMIKKLTKKIKCHNGKMNFLAGLWKDTFCKLTHPIDLSKRHIGWINTDYNVNVHISQYIFKCDVPGLCDSYYLPPLLLFL